MRRLLTLNPKEVKEIEHAFNPDASLKDWSLKRIRSLEKNWSLGSELILPMKSLRELCRNYGIEKLKSQDQFSSSRNIFKHFHQQLTLQK